MKVLSLGIYDIVNKPEKPLAYVDDIGDFGYFQQRPLKNFLTFFSKLAAERNATAARDVVTKEEYYLYVYRTTQGLATVLVTQGQYPNRVAFSLLGQLMDDYVMAFPTPASRQGSPAFAPIHTYLGKFQNPKESDALTQVRQELDETTEVLTKTMESLLQRGETLDTLVDKSNDLSWQSKQFYKTAKKNNSCCQFM
ncbi:palmitoyltransferase [Dispira parvispora]|uniref:Palmitoyltransferase n=1 Tax=Dispira parvispora TaxID=1520584 RepID=A0A9W8E3I5_9FUNG|nr:palmitoyltransferase [Dispira parvispora]